MRAIRFHGKGDIRLEELPEPPLPGEGQVRLRVRMAGICGSDLHNYATGQWISRLPVTPGHEFCAEVLALGPGVSGLAIGDLVVVDSRANCGECDHCRRGAGNLCRRMGFVGEVCDGGFAEQSVQPAHRLSRVPAGVDPAVAAMTEPLAVALRVVRQLAAPAGFPVVVAGGGCIGGLVALLLRELGQHPVLLAERNADRTRLLEDVAGIRPVALEVQAVRDACDGMEPAFGVEATGSGEVLNLLVSCVRSGGRIAMVGLFDGAQRVDVNQLVERELSLLGCSVFQDEFRDALALLPRLSDRLTALAAPPIALEDVPAAYRSLRSGAVSQLKMLVQPQPGNPATSDLPDVG